MRCSKCQFDNEEGARFCGNCGTPLVASPSLPVSVPPPPPPPPSSPRQIYCPQCREANDEHSRFCRICGARLSGLSAPQSSSRDEVVFVPQKTSAAWWILPILIPYFGGIIAGAAVKKKDKNKAKWLAVLGIVMTFVWAWVVIAIVHWRGGSI